MRFGQFVTFLCFLASTIAFSPEENVGSDAGLFEGDMRLNREQRTVANGGQGIDKDWKMDRSSFNIYNPFIACYPIANEPRAMDRIRVAMEEWEKMTCIRFRNRTTERNYVEFFRGSGCWSYVGMNGGRQQLSLASGCWHKGTIVHEIGHALGFYHEQSRPDRDDFVEIKFENIYDGIASCFSPFSSHVVKSRFLRSF